MLARLLTANIRSFYDTIETAHEKGRISLVGDCSLYKLVGTNQPEMEGKFVLLVDSETGIINKFRLAFQFPETAEFCLVAKANTVGGEEFRSAESFSRLIIHTLPDQRGEPWRIMGTAATVEKFLEQSQSLHESPAAVETYSAIIFSEPPEEVPPKPYPTKGQDLLHRPIESRHNESASAVHADSGQLVRIATLLLQVI